MPFANRIRLPFYLSRPQYPVDEDVYLKANGTRRVLKSIVSKELEGKTDWMPARLHERLAVALRHDSVGIEGTKYVGNVRINGAYEIAWVDFLDYPVAPATFKAFEEAFAARNTRCDICVDDVTQMTLRDDYLTVMDEGSTEIIPVHENDSICCNNPVFSIYSYDSTYVDSISIGQNGEVSLTLKTPLPSTGEVRLFQYKVECGSQSAIASFYSAINGSSSPACPIPSNLVITEQDPSSNPVEVLFEWDAPGSPPADGYGWMLTSDDGMTETVIGSGTTAGLSITVNSLPYNTLLRFRVWSICGEDDISATLMGTITTSDEPDCTDEHLDTSNYDVPDSVTVDEQPCVIASFTVTRNQVATDDAICNNQCVSVIVRIEMDNGCILFEGFDFEPDDTEKTLNNLELGCGFNNCTALVSATVVNILEIDCP